MTSLEELCAEERTGVEPSQHDLDRVARRVSVAIGAGVGVSALSTSVSAGTKTATGVSKLAWGSSKLAQIVGAKSVLMWSLGAVTGVGAMLTLGAPEAGWFAPSEEASGRAALVEPARRAEPVTDEGASPDRPDAPQLGSPESRGDPEPGVQDALVPPPVVSIPTKKTPDDGGTSASRLARDARLLSEVTSKLNSGDHAGALALLDGAKLVGSPLGVEFTAARAVAYCSSGRVTQGRKLRDRLRAQAVRSPALTRVERTCGK